MGKAVTEVLQVGYFDHVWIHHSIQLLVTSLPSGQYDCGLLSPGSLQEFQRQCLCLCDIAFCQSQWKGILENAEREEGNILHFLENFSQCHTTNLAVFKRWWLQCSHSGCQGIESWNHLGQRRPLRSSGHDEWVLQKPQIQTWPNLYQPQVPQTDTSTNSPDIKNVDVCENSNLIYGIRRGMCLENKRVPPQAFWLWCLELQKQKQKQYTATDTGFILLWKQSLVSVGNSCEVWPRDSKPLSCYLVAKGIVQNTDFPLY